MSGRIVVPPLAEERNRAVLPMAYVSGLLDKVEKALLVVAIPAMTGIDGLRSFGDLVADFAALAAAG